MQKSTSPLVAPAYTGVTLLFSWIYLLFYAGSAGIEAAAPVSLMSSGYMLSAVFMTLTLLIVAFAPFRRMGFLMRNSVKVVVAGGLAASTVVLIAGGSMHVLFLILAGGALTGVFSGLMAQQWVIAYRRVGLKRAICSFPALMAMAVCICMTMMYLPRVVLYAVIVVLPIVSELMLHWVRLELLPKIDVSAGPKDKPLNFLLVLLPVAICYLASGFLDFFSSNSYYTFVFYALCAFIPFVVAGIFAFVVDRRSFTRTTLIPVAFLVVMGVPILSLHAYLPVAQFISIGELGLEVVVFIVAVAFSEFFDLSSLKVYALVRTCATLFNSIGWYAAQFVQGSYSSIASAQFSLLIVFLGIEVLAVCLIVAIVKAQKGVRVDADEPLGGGVAVSATSGDAAADAGSAVAAEPSAACTGEASSNGEADTASASRNPAGTAAVSPAAMGMKMAVAAAGKESMAARNGATGAASLVTAASMPAETRELKFERCCRDVAKEHELSKREVDVLELLARGYSAARIQKELYIAAGTVNYHTRNIYAKLGVHSKQEVIDLMAQRMEG